MPYCRRGEICLYYEESGKGFPLLIISGGGMDSSVTFPGAPFNAVKTFESDYRCITMDLRNSNRGQSTGPLELERPWDMYTDDHLTLLDHLGVDQFLILGFCIGNPLIWNLIKRASARVVAAVSAQPSAIDPRHPDLFYTRNLAKWGPALRARRPDITMGQVEIFLTRMYRGVDFVITASRDFVRNSQVPILVLPDDTESHPYDAAMEVVRLAPNAQVSFYPWKNNPENVELAVRHIRTFLKANRPWASASAAEAGALSMADRQEI